MSLETAIAEALFNSSSSFQIDPTMMAALMASSSMINAGANTEEVGSIPDNVYWYDSNDLEVMNKKSAHLESQPRVSEKLHSCNGAEVFFDVASCACYGIVIISAGTFLYQATAQPTAWIQLCSLDML